MADDLSQYTNKFFSKKAGDTNAKEKIEADVRALCQNSGYTMLPNKEYYSLGDKLSKRMCDFTIVSCDLKDKAVEFDGSLIKREREDKMYVAIAVYDVNKITDVYFFPGHLFGGGLFAKFKINSKTNKAKVVMGDKEKISEYLFANMVKSMGVDSYAVTPNA
jgi:hypothetical protein